MLIRAKDALDRGEFLQEFIPVPRELTETISGFVGDPAEQKKLEEKTKANLEKFGYGNWYDYCVGEWGTKWDTGEAGNTDISPDGKILHTGFDTAWAPPIAAYEKLMDLGFRVKAMYYESGMAYAGVYDNGDDDYYEFSGQNSSEVADMLPTELDAEFGISECMAEYEDEEPLTEWYVEGAKAKGLIKDE
jgi:hypothetical protein